MGWEAQTVGAGTQAIAHHAPGDHALDGALQWLPMPRNTKAPSAMLPDLHGRLHVGQALQRMQ